MSNLPALIRPDGSPLMRAPSGPRNEGILGWAPARRAPDWQNIDRPVAVARAREMVETDGIASGAITKTVDAVVGSQLRLKYTPSARALGLDDASARDFAEDVQALWDEFATDPRGMCDQTRHSTMGGLFALAYRHYLIEGDAIGALGYDETRPSAFNTTLRVVDPDLLSNPNDRWDSPELRGGVEIDADGAAVAYHFRGAHDRSLYADRRAWEWTRVPREDEHGCPFVVHFFDRQRDGQTRGRSNIDVIVEALKMEDKHARVELQAAVLDAVMAPFVRTNSELDSLSELFGSTGTEADPFTNYVSGRASYYDETDRVSIDGVRVNRLYPGDEMGVAESRRPSQGYEEFSRTILRRIASGLGISYEQMTSDWSKTNYSSARAALNEIWRSWTQRRLDFVQRFCAPVFACFFEEIVTRGFVALPAGTPDLHAAYGAWTRVEGIGPGRGFVDPVKEVQASVERMRAGLTTMEKETAELTGGDWRDNQKQLARERDEMADGFTHPAFAASNAGHNGGPPLDEDADERDRKENEAQQ